MRNERSGFEQAVRRSTGARRLRRTLALALASAALASGAAAAADSEVVRTLRAELSGADAERFVVENLAGTMWIKPSADPEDRRITVVATVHAESDALADGMRLERVTGDSGAATLRVRYPADVATVRYREPHDHGTSFPLDLSYSNVDYDGRSYRVTRGHGKRVSADLEVRVPARLAKARFRNLVGLIDAEGLEGTLRFDVTSADLALRRLSGDLTLEGASGDIQAREIRGSWSSDFSSGDIQLENFDGDRLSFKTSSGDVRANGVQATRVAVDTSSGDVSLRRADIQEYAGESSSGDLRLEVEGSRLVEIRAQTSSGDVQLRLPRDASFEAMADQSSGDMNVGFDDGATTERRDKVVGYRRGSGGARIRVETSSGDLSIFPTGR